MQLLILKCPDLLRRDEIEWLYLFWFCNVQDPNSKNVYFMNISVGHVNSVFKIVIIQSLLNHSPLPDCAKRQKTDLSATPLGVRLV